MRKKGLHFCSRCGKRSYHADGVRQHIRDVHKGNGKVMRELSRRELMKVIQGEMTMPPDHAVEVT